MYVFIHTYIYICIHIYMYMCVIYICIHTQAARPGNRQAELARNESHLTDVC